MPVRALPSKPNLDHLKYQAKDLLRDHGQRDLGAAQRIREFHPRFAGATDAEIFNARLRLSDAQLAIARESGFPSWARLKRHIEKPTLSDQLHLPHHERIEDATFRRGVELLDAGDVTGLRAHLRQHPNLTRQRIVFEGGNYFHNPTLLEFVAENPIRHSKLPGNIIEVTKVILDAGVEQSALNQMLGLVVTGSVVRECRVQVPLIDLLCDFEDARRLLPGAASRDRHLALALASQFGHVEIVRLLLDVGEDPNRYNPVGCHSHSTPLHQAAWAGHMEVVRLLVERGAKLDLKDILWRGTPAGWARHGGRLEIEAFLHSEETDGKKHE